MVLGALVMAAMIPPSQAHLSNRKKLMLAKKIGAFLLMNRKKYLFAVPFPLPIPLPLLKKTQPIIYKEKVAVPVEVPVHEPVHEPWPQPAHEPWAHHGAPAHHGQAYPQPGYAHHQGPAYAHGPAHPQGPAYGQGPY
ncbi:hypothetical protein HDE_13009 [Halotydeus destructor]|nr:hypothetical protein HDE_13009 [Halotydeus destructor]